MNLFDYFGDINAFGAGPDARAQSLLDAKLITPEAMASANKRSIGTGIMTGIASYLAQPKNQNYGSVVPYLGKAYLNANQAAQAPFQGMTDKYLMDTKIAENKKALALEEQNKKYKNDLLADPRVQADPLLRQAALTDPVKVYEVLNKPPVKVSNSERLAILMTMDEDPNQELTKGQKAEMKVRKQIASVSSPSGLTFGQSNLPPAGDGYYYPKDPKTGEPLLKDGAPYVLPVQGTAEDLKRIKEDKKEKVGKDSKASIAATVIVDAQRALDLIDEDRTTTGLDAWAFRQVPSTKAYALDQMVKSIQANIGIDKLLDIKASGAGLGQVPQAQLEMLASVLGQLNTAQDYDTVRFNVDRVLTIYKEIVLLAGGDEALTAAIKQSKETPERRRLDSITETRSQEDQALLDEYSE